MFWTRQVLALACGLVFGVIPMKGFAAVLLAVMANLAGTQVYFSKYLGIDLDLLNVEPADAHKEGAGPAFAVYMVGDRCVILLLFDCCTHTTVHPFLSLPLPAFVGLHVQHHTRGLLTWRRGRAATINKTLPQQTSTKLTTTHETRLTIPVYLHSSEETARCEAVRRDEGSTTTALLASLPTGAQLKLAPIGESRAHSQ